eukprot:gene11259-18885_t
MQWVPPQAIHGLPMKPPAVPPLAGQVIVSYETIEVRSLDAINKLSLKLLDREQFQPPAFKVGVDVHRDSTFAPQFMGSRNRIRIFSPEACLFDLLNGGQVLATALRLATARRFASLRCRLVMRQDCHLIRCSDLRPMPDRQLELARGKLCAAAFPEPIRAGAGCVCFDPEFVYLVVPVLGCCNCKDLTTGGVIAVVILSMIFWPLALIPCMSKGCKTQSQAPVYGFPPGGGAIPTGQPASKDAAADAV